MCSAFHRGESSSRRVGVPCGSCKRETRRRSTGAMSLLSGRSLLARALAPRMNTGSAAVSPMLRHGKGSPRLPRSPAPLKWAPPPTIASSCTDPRPPPMGTENSLFSFSKPQYLLRCLNLNLYLLAIIFIPCVCRTPVECSRSEAIRSVIISFTSALVLRGRRRKLLLLSRVNQPDKCLDHKIREGKTVA